MGKMLFLIFVVINFLCDAVNTVEYNCKINVDYKVFDLDGKPIPNITEYTLNSLKPIVSKCCGKDEVIYEIIVFNEEEEYSVHKCISWNKLGLKRDYTGLKIYKQVERDVENSSKIFFEHFQVIQNRIFENDTCMFRSNTDVFPTYLFENGSFASDLTGQGASYGWMIRMPEHFCVDLIFNNDTKIMDVAYFVALESGYYYDLKREISFEAIASLISAFFLVLVLLAYSVLPQLQNWSGKLFMSYMVTQLLTFVLKAVLNLNSENMDCKVISATFYFSYISTFFWFNIMSYDIWWIFRGLRLTRPVNRRGEAVKFGWYSLYAWGVPLAVTLVAVCIDINREKWLEHVSVNAPYFNMCMNSPEADIFTSFPVGLLIAINIVFFGMTVYNIWLIRSGLKAISCSSSNMKTQNRFYVYLKLSLLMGPSWLLDLYYDENSTLPFWAFVLMNFYNTLIGVVIFIMFVINKKTLKMLCKRFDIQCRYLEDKKFDPNSSRSTIKCATQSTYIRPDSEDSDLEMNDVSVSTHPNPSEVIKIK